MSTNRNVLSSQLGPGDQVARPRRRTGSQPAKTGLLLLIAWVASLTFNLDVISEFKAYDILGPLCIIRFRGSILLALSRPSRSSRWLIWFSGFVLLGTLITVLQSSTTTEILVVGLRFYRVLCAVCLFLILSTFVRSLSQAFLILRVIFIAVLVQAGIIVLQWVGMIPVLWPEAERYYVTIYPTGTLGLNHLNSVIFMIVGLAAGLGVFFGDKARSSALRAPLFGVCAVIMIAAMLAGESLSGLVALPTLALSMCWRLKGLRVLLIVVICAVFMRPFLATDLPGQAGRIWQERVTSRGVEFSGDLEEIYQVDRVRPRLWIDTVKSVLRRPGLLLTGTGFQNFRSLDIGATGAHNQYLTVLAELGIGGFLVFVMWLLSLLRSMGTHKRLVRDRRSFALLAARSSLITLMVLGLFNSVLYPARALPGFFGFALAYFGTMLAIKALQSRAWSPKGVPLTGGA